MNRAIKNPRKFLITIGDDGIKALEDAHGYKGARDAIEFAIYSTPEYDNFSFKVEEITDNE